MSRTTLCAIAAAVLATASLAWMATRSWVLGDEVKAPRGAGAWKITMTVQAKSAGQAQLRTTTPLELDGQHVVRESYRSEGMAARPGEPPMGEARSIVWMQEAGAEPGTIRVHYVAYCTVRPLPGSGAMSEHMRGFYAPPAAGEYLRSEANVECDDPVIGALARRLTEGLTRPADQVQALFRYVDQEIVNEPAVAGPSPGAAHCLRQESGDARAKSRLLVALCRNCGIPARLVTGLNLSKSNDQHAHYWVEAWVRGHWLPMCPLNHHFDRLPAAYLIFGLGETPMVRGRNVRNLSYAFMVEKRSLDTGDLAGKSWLHRLLTLLSLQALPLGEHEVVEFLLLLPIAALIVCVFRNLVGISSFGTFAPALVGLAFRDLRSWPGILIFVAILLVGWLFRRALDRLHLLQVPRMAFLLSLVAATLIVAIVAANDQHIPATKYIALFPMVILVGMIERFWTLEEEDGTRASFLTLIWTMLIAAAISLATGWQAVSEHMLRFPETLGIVMAGQLLLGRYTGFRLTELFRFRDFIVAQPPALTPPAVIGQRVIAADDPDGVMIRRLH